MPMLGVKSAQLKCICTNTHSMGSKQEEMEGNLIGTVTGCPCLLKGEPGGRKLVWLDRELSLGFRGKKVYDLWKKGAGNSGSI